MVFRKRKRVEDEGTEDDFVFDASMCMKSLKALESEVSYLKAAQRKMNKDIKF